LAEKRGNIRVMKEPWIPMSALESAVVCHHCGVRISMRRELIVAGKGLWPLHEACFPAWRDSQPFVLRADPINRGWAWLKVNGILVGMGVAAALAIGDVDLLVQAWPLLLVANVGLLAPRLLAWWSIERKLR
jgi:hypothetical protein